MKALSKRHAEAKKVAFQKGSSTSIKKKIRSMSFRFKSQSMGGLEKKGAGGVKRESSGDPRVGYDMFSGGDNFGYGDESFDDEFGDGDDKTGDNDELNGEIGVDADLSVRLVFKIRLFVQYIFHKIDHVGVMNPVSKYKSTFRSLLFYQIERYIASRNWPMEISKVRPIVEIDIYIYIYSMRKNVKLI